MPTPTPTPTPTPIESDLIQSEAGVFCRADAGYGMGCCAADIDNDGDLDVMVTNFGQDRLYRNDDGHYVEVSGVGTNMLGAGSAVGRFNRDGGVDLYIAS